MAALFLPLCHAAVDVDCAADFEENGAFLVVRLLLVVVVANVQSSTSTRAVMGVLGFG